ncbi:hypothetical protein BZL43_20340 [Pseudomonas sp. PICF141]|nr:hypothetical protein BZL43_20340 [Pseudomonas sp. PICF141]
MKKALQLDQINNSPPRCPLCSSCRACEAAFGCEALVNPADAVCLIHGRFWFDDCFAADRSLRQLLQIAYGNCIRH